jgi:hypothetical protein
LGICTTVDHFPDRDEELLRSSAWLIKGGTGTAGTTSFLCWHCLLQLLEGGSVLVCNANYADTVLGNIPGTLDKVGRVVITKQAPKATMASRSSDRRDHSLKASTENRWEMMKTRMTLVQFYPAPTKSTHSFFEGRCLG